MMNERQLSGGRVQFEALPGLWVEQGDFDGKKTYSVYNAAFQWLGGCNYRGKLTNTRSLSSVSSHLNFVEIEDDVLAAVQAFREAANTPPPGQPMPNVVWLFGGP